MAKRVRDTVTNPNTDTDRRFRDGLTPADARVVAAFRILASRQPGMPPTYRELASVTGDDYRLVVRACVRLAARGWIRERLPDEDARDRGHVSDRRFTLTAEAAARPHLLAMVHAMSQLATLRNYHTREGDEMLRQLIARARVVMSDVKRQAALDILTTLESLNLHNVPSSSTSELTRVRESARAILSRFPKRSLPRVAGINELNWRREREREKARETAENPPVV